MHAGLLLVRISAVLAACTPADPIPTPAPPDPDLIATSVVATLQAEGIQIEGLTGAPTPPSPTPLPERLLHSLYYLSAESGTNQVWRLERDAVNRSQVTFAAQPVTAFDVSPASGALAYLAGNQLFLQASPDAEPQLLIDRSDQDADDPGFFYRAQLRDPAFSPDGRVLAYALNGVHLLDIATGESRHVLTNELEALESGGEFPGRLFFPHSWSPNGERLLVAIAFLEGGTLAFLDPVSGALTELQSSAIVCCQPVWANNSASIFLASPYLGLIDSGLWQYDAQTGEESVLIPTASDEATINFVGWPAQAPDGRLYYFYSNTAGIPEGDVPLFMLRGPLADLSQAESLREDAFLIREALWAPDASLVLLVQAIQEGAEPLLLVHADGRPLDVLVNEAHSLRWGP